MVILASMNNSLAPRRALCATIGSIFDRIAMDMTKNDKNKNNGTHVDRYRRK